MCDETVAIHGGDSADSTSTEAVPMYQTVSHDFIDASHAGAIFDIEIPGFHYNRISNPTNNVLERRMAEPEGGAGALSAASGMAAVSYVLPTFGVATRFSADDTAASVARLIDDDTCAVFFETVGNPAGNVVDVEPVSAVAHARGVPVIVDNTLPTPLRLKPIRFGADVVVHSLTNFVGGHGTTLGGVIVDAGSCEWEGHPARFPMFNQPEPAFHDVVFARDFPGRSFAVRARSVTLATPERLCPQRRLFISCKGWRR